MKNIGSFVIAGAIIAFSRFVGAETQKIVVSNDTQQVIIESLSDDLLRVEYAPLGPLSGADAFDVTSPLILQKNYKGPSQFQADSRTFQTKNLSGAVDAESLCLTVTDRNRQITLSRLCPFVTTAGDHVEGLKISKLNMQNIYGLGEQFKNPGKTNGDWLGQVRESVLDDGLTMKEGNRIYPFDGAGVGNAQFPIMYAVGAGFINYALFMDQIPELRWDFAKDPWIVSTRGHVLKFYIITGPNLPSLRKQYMDLVGHPLVPPKKAFGFWLSEFGYRNWGEIDGKLSSLRANHFPIDGFVLDALWYGSFTEAGQNFFGTFQFAPNFPDPVAHIKQYNEQDGIGLMLHETPFVSRQLTQFSFMAKRGYLLQDYVTRQTRLINGYLGQVGYLDYTNDEAADIWHRVQREPLIRAGVNFHWTDFAELDTYGGNDWWHGVAPFGHTADENHNLLPLKWSESIARGYDNSPEAGERHFILARSGASGIQRYGAGMWSGDIASRLSSLAAQLNVQTNMSLSGIDYFGSDIGGYHRNALRGDLSDVYTKWFAHGAAFDVPIRPHTDNGSKQNETAPDHIGDFNSNLANLRLRYELSPYYYSLAHEAYLSGSPLFPPAFFYFQNDPKLRLLYDEKMIGPEILVATAAQDGDVTRDIYLPAGDWFEYRTKKWIHSRGETISWTFKNNGIFALPYLMRAGAIIPIMWVDQNTENMLGKRSEGNVITDLNIGVFPSSKQTHFTVFEDDGVSTDYKEGKVAKTLVSQLDNGNSEIVSVAATSGTYNGAPEKRKTVIRVYLNGKSPRSITLNGQPLSLFRSQQEFQAKTVGWFVDTGGFVIARTNSLPVTTAKNFKINF